MATDLYIAVKSEIDAFIDSHLHVKERAVRAHAQAIDRQVNVLREALIDTVSACERAEDEVNDSRRCTDYLTALTSLIIPRVAHALRQLKSAEASPLALGAETLPSFMQQPPAELFSKAAARATSSDSSSNLV